MLTYMMLYPLNNAEYNKWLNCLNVQMFTLYIYISYLVLVARWLLGGCLVVVLWHLFLRCAEGMPLLFLVSELY